MQDTNVHNVRKLWH